MLPLVWALVIEKRLVNTTICNAARVHSVSYQICKENDEVTNNSQTRSPFDLALIAVNCLMNGDARVLKCLSPPMESRSIGTNWVERTLLP